MGRTACTESQCLYKGVLYLFFYKERNFVLTGLTDFLLLGSKILYQEYPLPGSDFLHFPADTNRTEESASSIFKVYESILTTWEHVVVQLVGALRYKPKDRGSRSRTTALLSPSSDGKPEATTAVELLMMGMRMPEKC